MKNRAFTLIEVITAIFVLLVGILGAFAVTRQIISYISFSNSKLSAAYLAQEGIEIVRNIRDTNWFQGENNWDDGLRDGDWEADYTTTTFSGTHYDNCSPASGHNCDRYDGDVLNVDGRGFYGYGAGVLTEFTRKITITSVESDTLEISVLVEWKEGGKTNKITVRENLYNYY
jgi:prepilin-type N-terminal cleavage/methylation domain-containing protein